MLLLWLSPTEKGRIMSSALGIGRGMHYSSIAVHTKRRVENHTAREYNEENFFFLLRLL